MPIKLRFSAIFVLVGLLFASLQLKAESLKVGLGELDYPPFYYVNDDKITGIAIEIAQEVARRSGYTLDYHRVPWKRLQYKLREGSLDMVILYFKTQERARDVIYTDIPHVYENSYIVVPKTMQLQFDGSLRSISDKQFFYVRGYSHGKDFDSADYLNKQTVNNETELLRRITSGRPFIGVGNKPALLMYSEQAKLSDKIRFLEPPIDRGENYMAFSKKRSDAKVLAALFSKHFKQYSETEDYQKVLSKYGF